MIFLYNFIGLFAQIISIAIFVRALLSWFPAVHGSPLAVILNQITDPVLQPLRRVVPPIGMMDITPLVAIILLQVVSEMARALVIGLA